MQQRILRVMLFAISTLILTGLVAAQPRPASSVPPSRLGVLSGLAAYVPSDALFYASAHTDAEAIAALNALLTDVTANLPDVMPLPPVEETFSDILGVPFSEIQSWLGDGIAVAGILRQRVPIATLEGSYTGTTLEGLYIMHVTDADAAEVFLRSRGITAIGVYNDVLVFSDTDAFEQTDISGSPTLLDQPAFVAAIESFESRSYAGIVYADLPLLIAQQQGQQLRYYGSYGSNILYQTFQNAALLRMFGPVAAGFTRGADGDLMLDVAVTAGNLTGIRPLGLNLQPPEPADPALLAVVPDDAFMVTQGSNLSGGLVELYRAFGPMLKDAWAESMIEYATRFGYTSPVPYELMQDMDVFTLADLVLGNALGLTLSDLQNWSSDDYVVFSRLNPNWPPQDGSRYVMPVEAAGVFRVARPEQSFAAFENLARTLQLWAAGSGEDHIDVRIERQEAQRAVFVTVYLDGREKPGTTIALYVTGDYAILGARGAADAALARLGTTETAAWLVEAAANFQPKAAFSGVFDPTAFVPALVAITGSESADDVRPYLAKLDTLAFDLRVASNDATVMRFTLGLNDAGGIETALGRPTLVPPPPLPTIMVLPTPTPFMFQPESTVELDPVILQVTQTVAAATEESVIMTATASQNIMMTVTANALLPEATAEMIPETAMLTATWDAAYTQTAAAPTPTLVPTATDFPLMPVISEAWGIPAFRAADGAFVLGNPDAPTTLVVFSDWACPHCQTLAPVINEFIATDVVSGAVNLEHRTLITAGGGATGIAAGLAECVEIQKPGAFWSAYPMLFEIAASQPDVYSDPATLSRTLAATFEVEPLGSCYFTATQINTDELYAAEVGANYTPFVAVRNADGTLTVVDDRTLEGIREAVYGGQNMMPAEMTPTFTPDSAEATRAAELANAAATQAAAGQPTATPVP